MPKMPSDHSAQDWGLLCVLFIREHAVPSHSGVASIGLGIPTIRGPFLMSQPMRLASAMVIFCGVVLLRTALSAEGSGLYHITMEGSAPYYTPVVATVPAGYRIQWDNRTATVHTVTHDACLTGKACVFDSGSVAPGNSFSLSLLQPGIYSYYCRLHPIMRGAITVIEPRVSAGRDENY